MSGRTYRPTTLRLAAEHCPAAIDYYEAGTEVDRRHFEVGTAAHAMMEALSNLATATGEPPSMAAVEEVTLEVGGRLIRDGRMFDGRPEPPLGPDAVWSGRRLVLAYVEGHPVEPGAQVEVGLGATRDWTLGPYTGARFRLAADCIQRVEEVGEESEATVLVITDYKTAWPADGQLLDSLQIRAQAVLAHLHRDADVDCVRSRVVNLRTGAEYVRDLWLLEDGERILRLWRDELSVTMDALDARIGEDGRYRASPGGGCIGCPYVAACAAGKAWRSRALEEDSLLDRARSFAVSVARVEALKPVIQEELGDGLLDLGAGQILGHFAQAKREPIDGAALRMWQAWLDRAADPSAVESLRDDGFVAGFLEALGIGTSQVESVGKRLFKPRVEARERDAWVADLVQATTTTRWGIHDAT